MGFTQSGSGMGRQPKPASLKVNFPDRKKLLPKMCSSCSLMTGLPQWYLPVWWSPSGFSKLLFRPNFSLAPDEIRASNRLLGRTWALTLRL